MPVFNFECFHVPYKSSFICALKEVNKIFFKNIIIQAGHVSQNTDDWFVPLMTPIRKCVDFTSISQISNALKCGFGYPQPLKHYLRFDMYMYVHHFPIYYVPNTPDKDKVIHTSEASFIRASELCWRGLFCWTWWIDSIM